MRSRRRKTQYTKNMLPHFERQADIRADTISYPLSVEIEVLGKDVIPTWLVSDQDDEIVSEGGGHRGSEIVDAALVMSMEYLKTLLSGTSSD